MRGRYEIRDTHHAGWRGMRFTSEKMARRELTHAVGEPGRWELYDRLEKRVLVTR